MRVGFEIVGLETLRATIRGMTAMNKRAIASAFSTVGFNLKKAAKDMVKNNSIGWPDIRRITRVAKKYPAVIASDGRRRPYAVIQADRGATGISKSIWGSLVGLLVYSFEKDNGSFLFGFASGTYGRRYSHTTSTGERKTRANVISEDIVGIAKKLTEGFTFVVGSGPAGDAQRRYLAALGVIFKKNTILTVPARPLVGPTFLFSKRDIPIWFQNKFWEKLAQYAGAST